MGVSQLIWLREIIGGMLLMCQNTTMRVAYMEHGLKDIASLVLRIFKLKMYQLSCLSLKTPRPAFYVQNI